MADAGKPLDTFAREALIRITARSTYTDTKGRKWWPKDFLLSAMLETHDWPNEPMILISLGKLKQRLGLPPMQRRFSFAQLAALPELNRLAGEAHALKQAEKPLDRVQQEAMTVGERMALFARMMDGSGLLIVPAPKSEVDPWVIPPDFGRYYSEEQFAPVRAELQATATAYVDTDSFNSAGRAKALRDGLRALSPSVYPDFAGMRLEYFYNHLEAFYRAVWLYAARL